MEGKGAGGRACEAADERGVGRGAEGDVGIRVESGGKGGIGSAGGAVGLEEREAASEGGAAGGGAVRRGVGAAVVDDC